VSQGILGALVRALGTAARHFSSAPRPWYDNFVDLFSAGLNVLERVCVLAAAASWFIAGRQAGRASGDLCPAAPPAVVESARFRGSSCGSGDNGGGVLGGSGWDLMRERARARETCRLLSTGLEPQ
jgi:hypothetical protein